MMWGGGCDVTQLILDARVWLRRLPDTVSTRLTQRLCALHTTASVHSFSLCRRVLSRSLWWGYHGVGGTMGWGVPWGGGTMGWVGQVEALFYNAAATTEQQRWARRAHAGFLKAYGLSSEDVPLLRLDLSPEATDAFTLAPPAEFLGE
jgi:hypothetical protein